MKTLNLNKRQVLYGLLVLTLGMSKSWLQTAKSDLETSSLSQASIMPDETRTPAPAPRARSGGGGVGSASRSFELTYNTAFKGCNTKKARVELVTEQSGPREEWNGTEWVASTSRQNIVYAHYSIDCKGLDQTIDGRVEITNASEINSNQGLIDAAKQLVRDDAEEQIKNILDARTEEESIRNCEKSEDGKDLLDAKYLKDHYACLSRNVREISDRDERRDAFQTQIVDSLKEAMLNSTSDTERRQIMAALKEVSREFKYDSTLKSDVVWLERGMNALNQIPTLAENSLNNPNSKLKNTCLLSSLSNDFDLSANRNIPYDTQQLCAQYGITFNTKLNPYKASESTKALVQDWSNDIMPLASAAMKNPESIMQKFFEDMHRNGLTQDASGRRQDQHGRDTDMNGGGDLPTTGISGTRGGSRSTVNDPSQGGSLRYIPRWDTDTSSRPQNYRSGNNNGGYYQQQQPTSYRNNPNIDPRTGRPYAINPGYRQYNQQNYPQQYGPTSYQQPQQYGPTSYYQQPSSAFSMYNNGRSPYAGPQYAYQQPSGYRGGYPQSSYFR